MRRKIKALLGILLFMAVCLYPSYDAGAESASAEDFRMRGDTLIKYTGTASVVSIPVSVKHIGDEAFLGHPELIRVDIPAYVEDIGYNAFGGCTSLQSISIPDTVTEVGIGAFKSCTSLKSAYLGKSLKKLGDGAFAGCTALDTMKINKDNTEFSYSSGALYNKDKTVVYTMLPGYKTDTYKMPSSVKQIAADAFWGCTNLKKVEIGADVKEIPDYAFSNCKNLETVLVPYSVKRIGLKAFADCIGLEELELPESVKEIHKTAFDGCPELKIIAKEGSKAAEYEEERDKSSVAQTEYEDITHDPTNGEIIEGWEEKDQEEKESNGKLLGESMVVGGNAVVFIDNSKSDVLTGNTQPDTDGGKGTANPEIITDTAQTGGFPKYTIVNGAKIAAQAYYGDSGLSEYNMPESIKEIGDFSFARSGLASITIPDGVTHIGYGAFYHCDSLSEINIPDSVTEIEPSAFDKTPWMEERLADKRNPFTIVGDGILAAYAGTGSKVEIPEGVKQIAAEVFKEKKNIISVSLPNSLRTIGEEAFSGCTKLKVISGGDYVEQIKDRAFENSAIETIKIPASVREIGQKAYSTGNAVSAGNDSGGSGKKDTEASSTEQTPAAVFLGKSIPSVSYEKTATRLTNEEYRGAVLQNVRVAVVDGSIASASDAAGTVLDYDAGGFRGFVCSVEQQAAGEVPGRLRINFCVLKEKDVMNYTIPETVTIYGKPYEITNAEEAVVYASGETEEESEEGTVTVEINSVSMPEDFPATAVIEGSKEDFILRITDNDKDGTAISRDYKKVTAGKRMTSLQVYNLELFDVKRGMPITKLGNQKMTVTVPKPKGLAANGIKVVCTDEDGQLEKVEAQIVTVDGQKCVQFTAGHFSVYGFYN